MFETLSRENINIQMISTSEIAVSCVIEDKYTELAVRSLHDAFELGARAGRLSHGASARAAVFFGPGKPFEIREVPIPEVEPDGVLVRVTLANICGSDLHFWRGDAPLRLPEDGWIFGHEMTGRVARLGARVKTDSLGPPAPGGRPRRLHVLLPVRPLPRVPAQGARGLPEQARAAARARRSSRICTARSPTTTTCARAAQLFKVPDELSDEVGGPGQLRARPGDVRPAPGRRCASATAW